MIEQIVEKEFDDYAKEFFKGNEGLINLIVRHPNKNKCISNVVTELKIAELKQPSLITSRVIKQTTQSFVKLFAKAVIHLKEKEILSEQAIYQQKLEEDKIKDIQHKLDVADTADIETFLE